MKVYSIFIFFRNLKNAETKHGAQVQRLELQLTDKSLSSASRCVPHLSRCTRQVLHIVKVVHGM